MRSTNNRSKPDTIIVPDRTICGPYPDKCNLILQEFEAIGPDRYDAINDLTILSVRVDPGLVLMTAARAMSCLKNEGYIPSCLGIRDGVAIQARGIKTFRAIQKKYGIEEICLWRSVVENGHFLPGVLFTNRKVYFPFLKERKGQVIIEWREESECSWLRFVKTIHFTKLLPK